MEGKAAVREAGGEPPGAAKETLSAVRVRSLARRFGKTEALRGLDMTVRRGDIYGFLGRNGAGKTTTIRILAGLIASGGGTAELLGEDVPSGGPAVRGRVGFLVETPAFFPHLDGFDNLRCHALLMDSTIGGGEILECLRLFGLEDAARRKVGGYSLGMRQRLGLAQAFLGDPELIVLDEPSIGLDPGGVIAVREIIRRYAFERGTTFLVSSHILGEMERLCTRLGIIERGRMVAEGTLSELGAAGRVTVRISDPQEAAVLAERRFPGSSPRRTGEDRIVLDLPEEVVPAVVRLFVESGLDVREVRAAAATLEELFLHIVNGGESS